MPAPPPQVQPITVLKSDFKLAHLRQITANSLYIVYGLRAGQLRCINKASAGRALYKGHASPIADLVFFSPASNLLASASTAGDLIVRAVCEVDDPSGSSATPVPLAAPVMRAALAPPPAGGTVRLAWHPAEPRILAAASGGAASIFMVPPEPAAPPSEAAETAALEAAEPAWQLPLPPGAAATALAFSPAGDVLMAGDAQGSASAWALDSGAAGAGGPPAAALRWSPHGGDAVAYAAFLAQAGAGAPSLLVTGDASNRRLRLWRLPSAAEIGGGGGAGAELLQSLELASAAGPQDFFCHAALVPQAALLVLANAQRKQVHALHYHVDGAAAGAAFDFLATFSVKQPVLSMASGFEMAESEANPGQLEPHVQLYCIQPDAVQQYTLDPSGCVPVDEPSATAVPGHGAEDADGEVTSALAAAAAPADTPAPPAAPAAAGAGGAPDGALPVPPAVLLPSPMRLLHKEPAAGPKDQPQPPTPTREPPPPPPPTSLAQPKQQQQLQQQAEARAGSEEQQQHAAAAAPGPVPPAPEAELKLAHKQKHQHPGSLAPPASMPPLPTTLAAKAHGDKAAISREPSLQAASAAAADADAAALQPAVAPTVAVTPLPAAAGGGSDDLEEGEIPPQALAAGGPGANSAPAPAAASAADVAQLRRQMDRLVSLQQSLASQLKADVGASEAAIAARVEAAVTKALNKRAEEERRRAKDLEKALAQQISQVKGRQGTRAGRRAAAAARLLWLAACCKHPASWCSAPCACLASSSSAGAGFAPANMFTFCALRGPHLPASVPPLHSRPKANAALLAGVTKAAQEAAREQARAVLSGAAATVAPAVAAALQQPLSQALSRAAGEALAREAPAAAAAAAERAVTAALRGGALQEAVASQFAGRVAPAVESATRQMFGQVEAAFSSWLAESRQQAASSGLAAAVSQLQGVVGTLQRDVAEGQRTLVRLASQSSAGGAASGGGAPWAGGAGAGGGAAPQQDPRARIPGLLAARDYDGAFNAALSAANPELLIWTCRQVSPAALAAAEPAPLSQVCLLSLVQQLGANLGLTGGADTDLRLDWLTEVAPLLEPSNPTIAPHLRGVLASVMAALKALAGHLPHTDPVGRKAKLAIHVVNSLLHQ